MECSMIALIACFSWSNLYIDSGLSFQDIGTRRQEWRTSEIRTGSVVETWTRQVTVVDPYNPYGRFAIGYQMQFSNVTLSLEASHVSSLDTAGDRGVNTLSIMARWFPFR